MNTRTWLLILIAMVAATAARADVIEPATPISKLPATISKPGNYVVTGNLVLKSGNFNAITIKANNVMIDLNEHVLTTTATNTHLNCIESFGYNDTTIRNGTITGFNIGIDLSSGTGSSIMTVEKMILKDCTDQGMDLTGDVVDVKDCRLDGVSSFGMLVYGNYLSITGNEVYNTLGGSFGPGAGRAIDLNPTVECTVEGNKMSNASPTTQSVGIVIFSGVCNARNNVINGFQYGLEYYGGIPGKYQNNLTSNCTYPFTGGTDAGGNN